MDDLALEGLLRSVGRDLAYPAERDLWPDVRARLGERRAPWAFPRRPAVALAVLLLVLAATLALSPEARAIAREILRFGGIEILRDVAPPSARPGAGEGSIPGDRTTLDEARRRLGGELLIPAELGTPDEVYVATVGESVVASLVYRARTGLPPSAVVGIACVVSEVRGGVDIPVLGKVAGPGVRISEVSVNGNRGAWLDGTPHDILWRDERGDFQRETLRLAGNTLIWEQGRLALRIEANVDLQTALRLAASMR